MMLHKSGLPQRGEWRGAHVYKHAALHPCQRPAAPTLLCPVIPVLGATRARPAAAAVAAVSAATPAATLTRGRPPHKAPTPPSLPQFLKAHDPQDLTGYSVRLKPSSVEIGRVTGVLLGGGGKIEAAGMLLQVERQTALHPFQFKGQEKHLLPMVPEIIRHVDTDTHTLFAQMPKGFLELGRRSLYLSYLRHALPPFAQPISPNAAVSPGSRLDGSSNSKLGGSRSIASASTLRKSEGGRAEGQKGAQVQGARIMPTRAELEAHGQHDLVQLVIKAGGFRQVALDLGYHMPNLKRPAGFLQDLETLDAEISEFIAHAWVMIEDGARPYYYNQVTGAITLTRPSLATQPQNDRQRVLPTASHFKAASRGDIHYAIVTHHGGYRAAAEALGRRPVNQPETSEWLRQPHLLKEELVGLSNELGLQDNQLPSEQQLLAAGRADVLHAVRLLGGFPTAAQQLGLHSHRTSSRGSLKDLDTAASAFMLFRLQQLQQQGQQHTQQQGSQQQQQGHQQQQQREQPVSTHSEGVDVDASLVSSPPSAKLVPQLRARLDPLRLPFPKVRELVQADRYDLIYAQRLHDKQDLADRCGFSLQTPASATGRGGSGAAGDSQRPLRHVRSKVDTGAVQSALLCTLAEFQRSREKGSSNDDPNAGLPQQRSARVLSRSDGDARGVGVTPRALLQAVQAQGVPASFTQVVSQLRVCQREGRIVKVTHGRYALPPQKRAVTR